MKYQETPVVVIDYNAGNTRSVLCALNRLGVRSVEVTRDKRAIENAPRVIFPGVGEARSTMEFLSQEGLVETITNLHQPVLGICLGMQLLCSHSEENETPCLGVFPDSVRKFESSSSGDGAPRLKVPHMGWNSIHSLQGPLFDSIEDGAYVYFVHSYYVPQSSHTAAASNYGVEFSAAIHNRNFHAVQFHPEKSGPVGHTILRNFLHFSA